MSYFQNPFLQEYRGNWVLGDRQYVLTFTCPPNSGRAMDYVMAWNRPVGLPAAYDLSGSDGDGNSKHVLSIRMSIDNGFQHWVILNINIADNTYANLSPAPVVSALEPSQIVKILNADPQFSLWFTARLEKYDSKDSYTKIILAQKLDATRMRFYIMNGKAETVLRFNSRAGVAELPTYFVRDKVWSPELDGGSVSGNAMLVLLSPTNSGGTKVVDNDVIDMAVDAKGNSLNFDSHVELEDYQLLAGRASGLFTFQNIKVDSSDRITQIIEYPAGGSAGDLARKINYSYAGINRNPSQVTEIPYTLTDEDLVTP